MQRTQLLTDSGREIDVRKSIVATLCLLSLGFPIARIFFPDGGLVAAIAACVGLLSFFVLLFCGSWLDASRRVDATNIIIDRFGDHSH